jgi:hypothetical protein
MESIALRVALLTCWQCSRCWFFALARRNARFSSRMLDAEKDVVNPARATTGQYLTVCAIAAVIARRERCKAPDVAGDVVVDEEDGRAPWSRVADPPPGQGTLELRPRIA